jgi:hypothetical protein
MKRVFYILWIVLFTHGIIFSQEKVVSRGQFFIDSLPIEVVLNTDLKKLNTSKRNPAFQAASLTWKNADSNGDIKESIRIRLRGNNRRETCNLASLMIDFRVDSNKSKLKNLKEMKWVAPCSRGSEAEQFIFKEYLIYKMYNIFTDKSFRVRLLNISFEDENGKQKPFRQYGFAIEHVDDLKKRVDCKEVKKDKYLTTQTNYKHTTLVALFQYMVGNTDWAVPTYHNVKLLIPKDSSWIKPYVVPYDFDYAGAVNAPYAIPHESWGIEKVTDRLYMGFPRTFEEIKEVTDSFKSQRGNIEKMIKEFPLMNNYHKKEMSNFIDDFFRLIEDDRTIQRIFVDNARIN